MSQAAMAVRPGVDPGQGYVAAPAGDPLQHPQPEVLQIHRLAAGRSLVITAPSGPAGRFIVVRCRFGSLDVRSGDHRIRIDAGQLGVHLVEDRLVVAASADADASILQAGRTDAGPYAGALLAADGSIWRTATGAAGLVQRLIDGLAEERDSSLSSSPDRLARHIVGMVAVMCAETVSTDSRTALLQGAKEYVESRLPDLDLGPDAIARTQHISTRTLHRLFETDGDTVAGWIRHRRLQRCRDDLVDPASDGITVSAIGARWGLPDAAHFSRLFKSAYGCSPREYRRLHPVAPRPGSRTQQPDMDRQDPDLPGPEC